MDLLQRFRPATYWNVLARRIEKMEADEADNATLAASAIVGWNEAFADVEGVGPYTPEVALMLMSTPEISWMREQIENGLRQRENFFRASV